MKLYKKIIIICGFAVFMGSCMQAFANPEIGRQIHFVTDPTNADHESKFDAANCNGGVYPDGNGSARGWAKCWKVSPFHPWRDIQGWNTTYANGMTMDQSTGFDCELYDYSNNAGNGNGYNVTQYNSRNWQAEHTVQQVTGGYLEIYTQVCLDGLQQ